MSAFTSAAILRFLNSFPLNTVARTNRFSVYVQPPTGLGLQASSLAYTYIESVDMPSMTLATEEYELDGKPTIKVPYKKTPAGTVTLGIRLEEDGKTRNVFKEWQSKIITTTDNQTYFRKYYQEITGLVTITQLDLQLKPTFSVTLLNAYPLTVDTIQYDWNDMNNYVKQNVTIGYYDEVYS